MGPNTTWWRLSKQASSQSEVRDGKVVGRHDDGDPFGPQAVEHLGEHVGRGGVDAVERLVEDQQTGLLGDGPSEENPLPLAARQHAELVTGAMGQTDFVERSQRGGAVGATGSAQPPDEPIATHEHDLEHAHRELGIEHVGLGDVRDPGPGLLRRTTEHLEAAPAQRHQAEDRLDQRRLAGTVRTDQREGTAGVDDPVTPSSTGSPP